MITLVPEYYSNFKCKTGKCKHSCCIGWEIDIDDESLERFRKMPDVAQQIEYDGMPHFRLADGERCPFLQEDGLCEMILKHGEGTLCQICTDHPRFRNFWTDRVETGLGLVCEEATRLILTWDKPFKLVKIAGGEEAELPEDEKYLLELREDMFNAISFEGPKARLLEYLIYRHLPDALYDGKLQERIKFINDSYNLITKEWEKTDGSIESLIEKARLFSYENEYNDGEN